MGVIINPWRWLLIGLNHLNKEMGSEVEAKRDMFYETNIILEKCGFLPNIQELFENIYKLYFFSFWLALEVYILKGR